MIKMSSSSMRRGAVNPPDQRGDLLEWWKHLRSDKYFNQLNQRAQNKLVRQDGKAITKEESK